MSGSGDFLGKTRSAPAATLVPPRSPPTKISGTAFGVRQSALVADTLISQEELVGVVAAERACPFGLGGVGLRAEVVPAVRQLVAVTEPGRRRVADQVVLIGIDEVVRGLQLTVRAELRRELAEYVLVGVANLKLSPRTGIQPVHGAEDVSDSIRRRLTDSDPN